VAILLLPELLLIALYALVAILLAACLPDSHLFFGTLVGMSTTFGVVFALGAPLLVFHLLRLVARLPMWAVGVVWRARRRAGSPKPIVPAEEPEASSLDGGPPPAAADTPAPAAPLEPLDAPRPPGTRQHPRWPSTALANFDVCACIFLYLVLGITASLSWSRCAPAPTLDGFNNSALARQLRFPPDLKFGAATAAYQVEGGLVNSSWHAFERSLPPFEHTRGRGKTTVEHAGRAADMWELFDDDLRRMRDLNLQTYRFSLSWSRLQPSRGQFDRLALARYRGWLIALRSHGIEPVVTLLHYEEPLWVAVQGSWANASTADDWLSFVGFVARELGDVVDVWVSQNEPFVFAGLGWLEGRWPPGRINALREWWAAMRNLASAHRRAYALLHEADTTDADGDGTAASVGLAKNLNAATPARFWSVLDPLVAGAGVWGAANMFFLELIGGAEVRPLVSPSHYVVL